jgi:hypothetical protein
MDLTDLSDLLMSGRGPSRALERMRGTLTAEEFAALFGVALRQRMARTTVTLSDGTTGWLERGARTDDCFAACIATCLQVPIAEVPDPRLDERLQAGEAAADINRSALGDIEAWLASRGLRARVHSTPPVDLPRWIGVIPFPGVFNDHSVVMVGGEILFDPVDSSQYSRKVRAYKSADVSSGFSFEPVQEKEVVDVNE